jgi:hypothetical protein
MSKGSLAGSLVGSLGVGVLVSSGLIPLCHLLYRALGYALLYDDLRFLLSRSTNTTDLLNFYSTLQMFCLLNPQMNVCEPNPNTTISDFNRLESLTKKFCFHAIFKM